MRTLRGDLSRSPARELDGATCGPLHNRTIIRCPYAEEPAKCVDNARTAAKRVDKWRRLPAKYLDNRVHAKCVDKCPPEQYLPPMRIPLLRLPVDART